MTRNPNTPCSGCGKLLWSGPTSLPPGQRMCRECRRARGGGSRYANPPRDGACSNCGSMLPVGVKRRTCSEACQKARQAVQLIRLNSLACQSGPCDDCGMTTDRPKSRYGRFCTACVIHRKRARESRKLSRRRTVQRFTDITTEYERELRAHAKRCPLCDAQLTEQSHRPTSKHLDHIVPICVGGTHTMGNVRIICRTCNLTRPKDGSDVTDDQLERWAQDVKRVDKIKARIKAARKERRSRAACRCGRPLTNQSCPDCPIRLEERRRRSELGREAARMRADGLKWQEIVDVLGLSGTGAAYQVAMKFGDPAVVALWPRDRGRQGQVAA